MKFISQMEPWIGEEEKNAVAEYLGSGGWLTEFKQTRAFEQAIAAYVGCKYCSVVANGTVSLFAALKALGIGLGDEVVVPDYTMIASANAVVLAGATPVFVDVDRASLCLDIEQTERAITAKTRAIMLVTLNGRAPDMKAFCDLAQRHGVVLLEDAAQSLGSFQGDRHLGTFGAIGSFSFSAPKIITTGQGGALVTDDESLYRQVLLVRDFGRPVGGVDHHEAIGYNFKFTDLQAVVGIQQMKKLPWRVTRKREMFRLYRDQLADVEEVEFLPTDLKETAPWFMDVLVPDPLVLLEHLKEHGIGSRPFYPAIHSQPAYGRRGTYPNSEYAASHGLWLPSASSLTDEDIRRVCDVVRSYFDGTSS